ncbi:hypothetical protein ACQPWY_27220 [Pseudonocardia xinjiangensis]|uniref:hypothetical protein n=1 Tax=Pseudonocardia xinjiangensis TaxID=75289 RepID=UPI003D8DD099
MAGSTNGAPSNTARRVAGGISISGEWFYASGVHLAQWVLCRVSVDIDTAGRPDVRLALLPISDVSISNTWDMVGMEGSGSDSFTVREIFVPDYRTLPVQRMDGSARPWEEGERGYHTFVTSVNRVSIAGPIIGMAQGALGHVLDALAKGKAITGSLYTEAIR